MFDGTSWKFRILYFLTSMAPAYFLFIFTQSKLDILVSLGLFLIMISLSLILKKWIEKRESQGVRKPRYFVSKIESKNGDISSFLLGVILPSVISGTENFIVDLAIFITLQVCLFVLMIKSSSILPNVFLILLGLNIFEMEDGKFILSFRKRLIDSGDEYISITRLGDSNTCNTYIRKRK